jgi:hypothetical protein
MVNHDKYIYIYMCVCVCPILEHVMINYIEKGDTMVVCFVDIDEIIDNHCQEFLFITLFKKKKKTWIIKRMETNLNEICCSDALFLNGFL